MNWFFWYQPKFKDSWHLSLASERERITTELKPELVTVLDCDASFDTDLTREEIDRVKYRGPVYFDFDSDTLDEVIPQYQSFLTNLKAKGVNLNTLRLYASGGKGFHIEMPPETVMAKVPPTGVALYPHIMRELAHDLFVDTLDTRVYTGKKGRMWRCPNVQRENGKHKVQITVEEAMTMTPERYGELVAYSRPLFPVEPAEFNPALALVWATSKEKVEGAVKKRKTKKATHDALKRFGGQWPEAIKQMLDGAGIKDAIGFNRIALQLAVTASELGKNEDTFLADAQGLIEGYQGDSSRYGTHRKKRDALRDMYRYVHGNPCYEFSIGGIHSLLTREAMDASDLGNGDLPMPDEAPEGGAEGEAAPTPEDENAAVKVDKTGVYVKKENVWSRASEIGLHNPVMLMLPSKEVIGYEVDVYVAGSFSSREIVTHNMLASKSQLQTFTLTKSCSLQASDAQTSMIADILRRRTNKMGEVALVTQAVGVDLISPPGALTPDDYEIIWSSPEGVISLNQNKYRYRPSIDSKGGFYSDLANAGELTLDDEAMVDDLLHINSARNVARMLGWFVAAFLSPVLRRFNGKQFPSLQVYGPAGAGKSQSIALLNHLHYNMTSPKELSAAGQTHFPIIAAMATSSSLPVVIEELKPRELTKTTYDFLLNIFRGNYNALAIARGGVSKDSGASGTVVNDYANRAPLVFVGEAMETQTAMIARCVMVPLTEQDRLGCDQAFKRSVGRNTELGRLGKAIMHNVLALDVAGFRKRFDEIHEMVDAQVRAETKLKSPERPIYNLAVILMGLEFLKQTLNQVFGERFDERIGELAATISDHIAESVPQNMSEASKVLDVMAQMTRIDDLNLQLVKGKDYTLDPVSNTVDLKMKPAYAKYMKYMRSLGLQPLYDNDTAFITAMVRYEGTVAKACPDNPLLFTSGFEAIYRFSIPFMEKERIEPFNP